MTNEEILEIRALSDKATKGPWIEQTGCPWSVETPGDNSSVCVGPKRKKPVAVVAVDAAYGKDHILEANAAFIAAAREAVPALCADLLAARAENARLREALGPFSEEAMAAGADWPDELICDNITLGECRRARTALEGGK